jgi:hypothetical protein
VACLFVCLFCDFSQKVSLENLLKQDVTAVSSVEDAIKKAQQGQSMTNSFL